jgi:hypothetical protein
MQKRILERVISDIDIIGRSSNIFNKILCFATTVKNTAPQFVVYFQGDMQNTFSEMQSHQDDHVNEAASEYSLESTATYLSEKFSDATHIVMIRPSHLEEGIFAKFSNFTEHIDETGCINKPNTEVIAIPELYSVLQNVSNHLQVTSVRYILCGFSKGCSVLNSLVDELPLVYYNKSFANHQSTCDKLWSSIDEFHWLDSGNSQYQHYPNDKDNLVSTDQQYGAVSLFAVLCSKYFVPVKVYVSPYTFERGQVPEQLSVFKQQFNSMIERLAQTRSVQSSLEVKWYFFKDKLKFDQKFRNHFKVLKEFQPNK